MLRKKSIVTLALGVSMLLNTAVYAAEPVEKYNLEKLKEIYISESYEIRTIDLDTEMLKVQYSASIRSYKDFKEAVDKSEDNMNAMRAAYEQALYDAEKTSGDSSRSAAMQAANSSLMQYIAARSQYRLRVKEDIQMTQNLEPVIFQISQADAKKQNSIAKSSYELENDYYNLVTLHSELELLNQDIENMKMRIKVDETKEALGMSAITVRMDSENQLRELEKTKKQLENSFELALENMKTKLNINVEDQLHIEYSIPSDLSLKDYKLSQTVMQLKNNNLDLAAVTHNADLRNSIFNKITLAYERIEEWNENEISLKQYEDEQNQIKMAEIDYEKAKIQQYNLERTLELYAKQVFYDFQAARDKLFSNMLYNNDLYETKMGIIEANYKYELISDLEYQLQKQQLNRELSNLEKDWITFVNAKNKLELALKGIVIAATAPM